MVTENDHDFLNIGRYDSRGFPYPRLRLNDTTLDSLFSLGTAFHEHGFLSADEVDRLSSIFLESIDEDYDMDAHRRRGTYYLFEFIQYYHDRLLSTDRSDTYIYNCIWSIVMKLKPEDRLEYGKNLDFPVDWGMFETLFNGRTGNSLQFCEIRGFFWNCEVYWEDELDPLRRLIVNDDSLDYFFYMAAFYKHENYLRVKMVLSLLDRYAHCRNASSWIPMFALAKMLIPDDDSSDDLINAILYVYLDRFRYRMPVAFLSETIVSLFDTVRDGLFVREFFSLFEKIVSIKTTGQIACKLFSRLLRNITALKIRELFLIHNFFRRWIHDERLIPLACLCAHFVPRADIRTLLSLVSDRTETTGGTATSPYVRSLLAAVRLYSGFKCIDIPAPPLEQHSQFTEDNPQSNSQYMYDLLIDFYNAEDSHLFHRHFTLRPNREIEDDAVSDGEVSDGASGDDGGGGGDEDPLPKRRRSERMNELFIREELGHCSALKFSRNVAQYVIWRSVTGRCIERPVTSSFHQKHGALWKHLRAHHGFRSDSFCKSVCGDVELTCDPSLIAKITHRMSFAE